MRGFESAAAAGCTEVAIFGAATDSFSMRNINCNVMDSFERFRPVCDAARKANIRVRGYVSCVLGCPYEGFVAPDAVAFVAQALLEMGCYEISLGDTIGVGTPLSTKAMLAAVKKHVPLHAIAVHFHNTYAMGLPNILAALEEGVAVVDSSVAGLGGCPYAKGASGNVPTEDVVYMLHGMGIRTNVDLEALIDTGDWMCNVIKRENLSKVASARLTNRKAAEEAASKAAVIASGDAAAQVAASKELETRKVALCWPQLPSQFMGSAPVSSTIPPTA
jgi:hydroxymethylglutaryl-CoA lyase